MTMTETLHQDGAQLLIDLLRNSGVVPPNFYIGLRTCDGVSGHPSDANYSDSLTNNLAEVSTVNTGYARTQIANNNANWPRTQNGNIAQMAAAMVAFFFNGSAPNVPGITHYFVCTSADGSGKLIWSAPLPGNVPTNAALNTQIQVTPGFGIKQG